MSLKYTSSGGCEIPTCFIKHLDHKFKQIYDSWQKHGRGRQAISKHYELLLNFQAERRHQSRLQDVRDRLEQSDSTNRSLQNYVQFLKASYASVFGDTNLSGTSLRAHSGIWHPEPFYTEAEVMHNTHTHTDVYFLTPVMSDDAMSFPSSALF